MQFEHIGIIGAGAMGHGIAHVSAAAGYRVTLYDVDEVRVSAGIVKIRSTLDKGVEKGKVTPEARAEALRLLDSTTRLADLASADLLIEAIPERLELKQSLFRQLDGICGPSAVYATNTSSLSIAQIASAVSDPSRVIGAHFFNPVHVMTLLEVVVHEGTSDEVREKLLQYGVRIGKECIVVNDAPGFATSRLGVCLGMEAIRMVEQGVASPADIDKAMSLGYRHPVGPLRLTDMVGLDVRLAIGEYLSRKLNNPAFEPPALMRRMVAEGKLGQKTGRGFYEW
ncbi:MAG: 3-hydroxyacyl-CoA dehydrogenase family protein [Myxococcales bacterium]|nr:3-hydroxyacyl-CoA dehydrogenase family protein [Myxococcales bacterium]